MVQRPLGNHHFGPDTFLVTPETEQTDQVTEETEPLHGLITRTRYVLFDFDGPVCRLFAGHPATRIAEDLVEWLDGHGLKGLLTDDEQRATDPHVPLHAVNRLRPGSDLVAELEDWLTEQELKAVPHARPTPYADAVIRTWHALGVRMAVTTNNSARAASRYLAGRGTAGCFGPHVYGRTEVLDRMKPDPYWLNHALRAMGADAALSLMVGDSVADHRAANGAGVPFLGYAANETKRKALLDSGVPDEHIVDSLQPLLDTLWGRT